MAGTIAPRSSPTTSAIEIEAGLAFGTGHHGTTRGCLLHFDRLLKRRRPERVLDVGCGAGVLAIAAAKVLRRKVQLGDIDPVAVAVANDNARLNGVGEYCKAVVSRGVESRALREDAPYDVVFANILAKPLAPARPLARRRHRARRRRDRLGPAARRRSRRAGRVAGAGLSPRRAHRPRRLGEPEAQAAMTGAGAPQPTPADLGDAVARARASYDRTPYESLPYPRLQPARMAAAALWAGVAAPDVATARVLEIGCASGGHLIPLAAAWPKARFLGVDISPLQIAAGRDRIARAGLANIALDARSLHEIGAEDGAFDYIICHGLLSWVAEPLREALLRVVAERLAPNGVAMVSFNVLPGWRLIQVARDSLLLHARLGKERDRQALDGRALVEALSAQSNSRYSYGRIWRDEARAACSAAATPMSRTNSTKTSTNRSPSWTFCEALDRHGLAYLGDCNVAANLVRAMAPAAADTIAALAAGDERAREQYIDIFSGRAFREALIVRRDRVDAIHGGRGVELDRFHFVSASGLAAAPPAERGGPWRIGDGDDSMTVADEAAALAIRQLIARLPRSSTLEDLAPVADDRTGDAQADRRGADRARDVRALRGLERAGRLRDPA